MNSPLQTIFLVLLILPLLLSCSQTEENVVTFAVGGAPSELALWEELIKEFEEETSVRVNLMRQPTDSDQRRQGLVVSLAAQKDDPDVFLMDVVWLSQFADSDWLVPLDAYLEAANNAEVRLDAFFPNIIEMVDRHEGRLIALPVYVDGGALYYRRDLLEETGASAPPETWGELVTLALEAQKKMQAANRNFFGFLWQGAQYEGLICTFLEFAHSNGGGIVSDDGTIAINTQENLEAARFMVDLIHRWRISPPSTYTEMREEEVRTAFEQGNGLFERNWPYAWSLHQAEGSRVRGKIGIAPLPRFPEGRSASTLGGWHIGVSKFSDQKEQSWKLVQFVVSRETQRKLALKLGWTSGRKDIYDDPTVTATLPHFASLKAIFENAQPRPLLPYYTQISEILQRYLNAMLAGNLTPKAALLSAERDARRIVARYGKEQPSSP